MAAFPREMIEHPEERKVKRQKEHKTKKPREHKRKHKTQSGDKQKARRPREVQHRPIMISTDEEDARSVKRRKRLMISSQSRTKMASRTTIRRSQRAQLHPPLDPADGLGEGEITPHSSVQHPLAGTSPLLNLVVNEPSSRGLGVRIELRYSHVPYERVITRAGPRRLGG